MYCSDKKINNDKLIFGHKCTPNQISTYFMCQEVHIMQRLVKNRLVIIYQKQNKKNKKTVHFDLHHLYFSLYLLHKHISLY